MDRWVVHYGPYGSPAQQKRVDFERVSYKVLGAGDKIAYIWKRIE